MLELVTYNDAVSFINKVQWSSCKPGLDRIRKLLEQLGNPQDTLKFIHIAGTNGKGSTAAMLASIMRSSGYKTGLFTSPHLIRYNERMSIDGTDISDLEFVSIISYLKEYTDKLNEPVTEFELLTAAGFVYFANNKCDLVILEVGMGGELDSTNIIGQPELAIITAIGFDHCKQLGNTLSMISSAKAGIIKENGDVLVYGDNDEVVDVFKNTCNRKNASLNLTDFSRIKPVSQSLEHQCFHFEGYNTDYVLPLIGTYQLRNAAVAITAAELLIQKGYHINEESISKGIMAVKWPARFEVMHRAPTVIVDGAHNAHGIGAVAASLRDQFTGKRIIFLIGVLSDKNVDEMLSLLLPVSHVFVTLTPDSTRAMNAKELAERIAQKGAEAHSCVSVEEGLNEAMRLAGNDGIVCSLGSLYLAGAIRYELLK